MNTTAILLSTTLLAAALGMAHAGNDAADGLAAERQALSELVSRNARAELEASVREANPAGFVADDFIGNARTATGPSHEDLQQSLSKQLAQGWEDATMAARVSTIAAAARGGRGRHRPI